MRGKRRVEGGGGEKGAIREGVWAAARTIKANPDAPQRLARQLALDQGKTLFVAVPRLASQAPFLALEPGRLEAAGVTPREASTIQGAARRGRPVRPDEMPGIDLVLCGSVAVTRDGARVGKGGGYADLEYALARELGLVTAATAIVTLVHPLQILDAAASIPMTRYLRPAGIYWDDLPDEKRAAIPLLADRRAAPEQGQAVPAV